MFVADAHCDTLHQLERGRVPRMISKEALCRGGVGLQVFALFNGDVPPLPHGIDQALHEISLLSTLGVPLWNQSLPEQPPQGPIAVFSIEGAEILEDSLEALTFFRRKGVRMMNLTWNHENSLAIPALVGHGGLKSFGRTMVLHGLDVDNVPIAEAIAEPRTITKDSQTVRTARELGIIFGDMTPEEMAPKATRAAKAGKTAKNKK